ncbi:MAG: Sec-independent protein translocase protein TatB [Pseudomonadales bacterium]|nr:Sec-independent protein translocase protein TatB [Pseudomonadales bacterium]
MFDIGFPELLLVSVVALLVIGPDRLPETIRTIMLWLGRIRSSFSNIKTEIERELGADEIRQQLHNESIMQDLRDTHEQIQGVLKTTDSALQQPLNSNKPSTAAVINNVATDNVATDNSLAADNDATSNNSEPKETLNSPPELTSEPTKQSKNSS